MQKVNELILPENREEMFVTAIYGVLVLDTGSFTYANAGHNPPIWVCESKRELNILPRTGAALGIIEGLEITEQTIVINPEDMLLLYTDGLTEAFSPDNETFGIENLKEAVMAMGFSSAHSLLDFLEQAVDKFMDTLPASDDLTMLAIKRLRGA
jgi:sigma-B regulation protein RsbU (phosphoserine phosphatase)